MYTGLRFKGVVKKEFRYNFEKIAMNGAWEDSNDEVFKGFSKISRAMFIPCGALSYMPDEWETEPFDEYRNGKPTDGFDRTYNRETGRWTFQCSLKNYDDTIGKFLEIVPYFIEEVEHAEVFYEECRYSKRYELVDEKIIMTDDKFIEYNKYCDWF